MLQAKLTPHRIAIGLLCAGLYLLAMTAAQAAEGRKATVKSAVNLRTAPGFEAKVITKLEVGEAVAIISESGEWVQVVLENEAFGYRGWVASRYLKTDAASEAQSAAATPAPTPAPATAPKGLTPAQPAAASQPAQTAPAAETSAAPPTPAAAPPASTAAAPAVPNSQSAAPEKTAAPSSSPVSAPTPIVASEAAPSPPASDAPQPPSPTGSEAKPLPAAPKSASPAVVHRPLPPPQEPANAWRAADKIELGLRLATVLLACLAVVVSMRAYRIAKAAWEKVNRVEKSQRL